MAYDPGAIDAALAAAVGDEPLLIAELRLAFTEGAVRSLAAMEAATDGEEWRSAAWRLKGLSASFGAVPADGAGRRCRRGHGRGPRDARQIEVDDRPALT